MRRSERPRPRPCVEWAEEWAWIGAPPVRDAAPRMGIKPATLAKAIERARKQGWRMPAGAVIGRVR